MKKKINFETDEGMSNLRNLVQSRLEQQYNISYDEIMLINENEQDKIIDNVNKQKLKKKRAY